MPGPEVPKPGSQVHGFKAQTVPNAHVSYPTCYQPPYQYGYPFPAGWHSWNYPFVNNNVSTAPASYGSAWGCKSSVHNPLSFGSSCGFNKSRNQPHSSASTCATSDGSSERNHSPESVYNESNVSSGSDRSMKSRKSQFASQRKSDGSVGLDKATPNCKDNHSSSCQTQSSAKILKEPSDTSKISTATSGSNTVPCKYDNNRTSLAAECISLESSNRVSTGSFGSDRTLHSPKKNKYSSSRRCDDSTGSQRASCSYKTQRSASLSNVHVPKAFAHKVRSFSRERTPVPRERILLSKDQQSLGCQSHKKKNTSQEALGSDTVSCRSNSPSKCEGTQVESHTKKNTCVESLGSDSVSCRNDSPSKCEGPRVLSRCLTKTVYIYIQTYVYFLCYFSLFFKKKTCFFF